MPVPKKVIEKASDLALIEKTARAGGPQSLCASRLGMAYSTFKKYLGENDGDNPVRLAYEKGRAELENEVATLLLKQGRKGNTIALIYYSKAQLGWSEQPQVAAQIGVQIILPDSMSREAFKKSVEVRMIEPTKESVQ